MVSHKVHTSFWLDRKTTMAFEDISGYKSVELAKV